MSRTIKAIERHMILPVQRTKIDNSVSPVEDSPWRARTSLSRVEARCGMAATRTRNTFRTRTSKVAAGPSAHAATDNRECDRLRGA